MCGARFLFLIISDDKLINLLIFMMSLQSLLALLHPVDGDGDHVGPKLKLNWNWN